MITAPPLAIGALEIRAARRDQRLPVQRYAAWLYAGASCAVTLVTTLAIMLTSPWFGLAMVGTVFVCAGVLLPLAFIALRRRRLVVDARTLTSVHAVGRPTVFDRQWITALRMATATMSARGFLHVMGGPVLLLLDGEGRCLRSIPADRFTQADCEHLAEFMGVPITGTYADCCSFAELEAEHPGAATRAQLRAGRWTRLAAWTLAVAFLLMLVVLVAGIIRRGSMP